MTQVIGSADSGLDPNNCFFFDPVYANMYGQIAPFITLQDALTLAGKYPTAADMTVSISLLQYTDETTCMDDFRICHFPSNFPTLRQNRKIIRYITFGDNTDDNTIGHGTHVCGSLAGQIDPVTPPSTTAPDLPMFNGMSPEAKLVFFDAGDAHGNLLIPVDIGGTVLITAYDVRKPLLEIQHVNAFAHSTAMNVSNRLVRACIQIRGDQQQSTTLIRKPQLSSTCFLGSTATS